MLDQDPLGRLLQIVLIWMAVMLALAGIAALLKEYWPRFNKLYLLAREFAGDYALLFIAGVTVSGALFLLGATCSLLSHFWASQTVSKFGEGCYALAVLSGAGFCWWIGDLKKDEEKLRIKEAFLSPRTMQIKIGDMYGSNVSVGNEGKVEQTVRIDSLNLRQDIHALRDAVARTGNELTDSQKTTAIEKLNTLAEQSTKQAAERQPSKIMAALKVLPGLLSSANGVAQEWDKLEPWIRSHFGIG